MIILELSASVLLLGGAYKGVQWVMKTQKRKRRQRLVDQYVLSIVDKQSEDVLEKLGNAISSDNCINLDTMVRFNDEIKTLLSKGCEEIHIVLMTSGGYATCAEAIARTILYARKQGCKVNAWIPYYAYSAGCLIALTCTEIFMTNASVLGPTDAQMSTKSSQHSVKSICETIEWQLENAKEKIKPEWYAKYVDAKACKERQREFVDELIEQRVYSKEHGDHLYEELFSGKYNHDQGFDYKWARTHHLPVTCVEDMPEFVQQAIKAENGKRE